MGKPDFFYKVLGLIPPGKSDLGRWGFSIWMDPVFAVKAREFNRSELNIDGMQGDGREIAKRYGLTKMGIIENPYYFMGDSFLLQAVRVPGDACDLGLDESSLSDFSYRFEEYKKYVDQSPFVAFNPHNVDSSNQAYCLLSTWIRWADTLEAVIR